VTKTIT